MQLLFRGPVFLGGQADPAGIGQCGQVTRVQVTAYPAMRPATAWPARSDQSQTSPAMMSNVLTATKTATILMSGKKLLLYDWGVGGMRVAQRW